MDTIVAVVPTFNRKDMVRKCLQSLVGQSHPLDAVIVVDNGSTDGTAEMLVTEFPEVQCVYVPEPCGSAGGFNKGIDFAYRKGYEWIWLMDNDAVPASNALEMLVRALQLMDGRVFNSVVVTPDRETINWGYHLYNSDNYQDGMRIIRTVSELISLGKPILNGLAQFYTGSLIHRAVIDSVGLPNPGFFTRGDEVDYVLRIQQAGFKTYTVVESRAIHPQEPIRSIKLLGRKFSVSVMPPWKQYYALRNGLINEKRFNFGQRSFPLYYITFFLASCIRSWILPDNKCLRLMYMLWGYVDGVRGRLYVNPSIRVR